MTNPIDDQIRNVLARQAAALTPPDWHPGDAPTLRAHEPEREPGGEQRGTWWLAAAAVAVIALAGGLAALAPREDAVTTTGPAGVGQDGSPTADGPPPSSVPPATVPPATVPPFTVPSSSVRPDDQAAAALPGEWFDIGPEEGTPMDAIGVRYDDVLNLRSLPQAGAPIVATAVPLADTPDIRSAGEGRLFTGRVSWWKVTVDGEEAWANLRYLGALGRTEDILGGLSTDLPSLQWKSVDDLVAAIVAARSPAGDGSQPLQVEDVAPPTDTTRVFDLIGFADDSLRGERISITIDTSGDQVTLVGAERTLICHRGVSDGWCR